MRRPVYRRFKPRSVRKSQSRATRNLIFNLIVIVVLVFVFFLWGLPLIVGSLGFLNKNKPVTKVEDAKVDEAIAPPVLYIPFEATNSATLPLSGYATPLSKVELFVDNELKKTVLTDSEGKFSSESIDLNLGINNIYAITVNDQEKKSLPSKTIKLLYNNEKPLLEINEPADNAEIKGGDKKIKIVGITEPENSVTVNGVTVIVNSEGNFQTEINLSDGDNTITIISSNSFGNTNQSQKAVKYIPQEPSPSPSP